jgi:hypothetical protein
MDYALALVVLGLVVALVVLGPLRRPEAEERREDGRRAELEARRELKYREIRETELDFRTGKLSWEDFRRADRELRAEAIAILRELDDVSGGAPSSRDSAHAEAS